MGGTTREAGVALPLFARLLLVLSLLVVLSTGAAILATLWQGRLSAERAAARELGSVTQLQRRFEDQNFYRLQLQTDFVSADPSVAQYISAATSEDIGLESEGQSAGQASLGDLLAERKEQLQFDLGILVDAQGMLLARTDEVEAFAADFRQDPFLGRVIDELEPQVGYWFDRGKLYQAAASPIALDNVLVGFVMLGLEIKDAAAQEIAGLSGSPVAYWTQGPDQNLVLLASSWPADRRPALEAAVQARAASVLQALEPGGKPALELAIDGRNYAGTLLPLYDPSRRMVGILLGLSHTDAAKAPFEEVQKVVLAAGVLALLVTLAAAYFLAQRLMRPVRVLADLTEKAAAGDYSQRIESPGSDELGRLARAFDSLLSSLREKSDIQGYVASLSRFLPDTGGELSTSRPLAPARAPRRIRGLLLALDVRRYQSEVPVGQEGVYLTQCAELHGEAEKLARSYGGEVLEERSARLLLHFAGEQALLEALAFALGFAQAAGRHGIVSAQLVACVLEGELVHGSLPQREPDTAALGLAQGHIARLLVESPAGQILLAPPLAKTLLNLESKPTIAALPGVVSGKKFYSLGWDALDALPKPPPRSSDPNATRLADTTGRSSDANQTRIAPGQRLGGRYEVLGILGSGGMGVVYKARDVELDDVVALKMLRASAVGDAEQLDRLKSELKLARKITHPNVLRTYDFGDIDGVPFISMEFVRGMTLRYMIEQAGRIPYSAALQIARQVCAGLQAAHEVGVLHRDIKPENVILDQAGNAKLMDFGIARPIQREVLGRTAPGMFVGTPNYASPEQLTGGEVDARSDMYSLGIMLFEMFCGALPFKTNTTTELYLAHLQQPPTLPSVLWPDVPKELEAIILKCLAKNPEDRYADIAALGRALAELRA